MLAVVEDHERVLVGEKRQDLRDGITGDKVETESLRDGRRNLGTIGHRGQIDEPHAGVVMWKLGLTDGDREARLAGPTDRGDGHEPVVGE